MRGWNGTYGWGVVREMGFELKLEASAGGPGRRQRARA